MKILSNKLFFYESMANICMITNQRFHIALISKLKIIGVTVKMKTLEEDLNLRKHVFSKVTIPEKNVIG